jgi:MIP family channel proteins
MKDSWRHFISEFIGTFALVFIGSGAIIRAQMTGGSLGEVALAHGLILSVMVTALMRISGHFNPAVTLTFMAVRRIEPVMGMVYMIAQFTAAIVAAYALKGVFPTSAVDATRVGGQMIASSVSFGEAIVLELIATFFLVWVIFGTAVDPDAPRVGGFAIGLTIAADILAIGPLTGASMNPARSLGPAVASGVFEAQAVYWIGPIIGALIAGVLYDRLFLRRAPEPVDHGAVAP